MKDYSGPSISLGLQIALPQAHTGKDLRALMFLLWLLPVNFPDQEQLMLITIAMFLRVSDLEEVVEIR